MNKSKAKMRCPNCGYYYGGDWIYITKEYPKSFINPTGQRCVCCNTLLCLKQEDKTNNKVRLWMMIIFIILIAPFALIVSGGIIDMLFHTRTWYKLFNVIFIIFLCLFIVWLIKILVSFISYYVTNKFNSAGLISVSDKAVNIFEKKKLPKDRCRKCIEKYSPEKLAAFDQQIKDEN